MAGKAQLILVLGLGLLLGGISLDLNRWSKNARSNSDYYYEALTSHNLALAGAQVGITKVMSDPTWFGTTTYTENLSGGTYTVERLLDDSLEITSISTYNGFNETLHDSVEVYLNTPQFTSFTLFSWMTNDEGPCQWVTGDSVQGKLHSNGSIAINGAPVFLDKVTTANRLTPRPGQGTDQAIFKKGYETGVDSIFFPTDLQSIFNVANAPGSKYYNTPTIWVTLDGGDPSVHGDGRAIIRASQTGPAIDSVHLSADSGFTGVIMGSDTVHVHGNVDGQVTVASNMGNIYVDDNLLYEQDPRFDTTSHDMLGLVAEQSVIVTETAANLTDCVIQGNIFARTGSLSAQNYSDGTLRGRLSILGSIVQNIRGAVGTNLNGVLNSGYFKSYAYDKRLYDPNVRPPSYPGYIPTNIQVTGWWESLRLPDFSTSE